MNDFTILERLQEDLRARLLTALPAGVSVLMQREGVLEREIETRLGTLNARDGRSGVAAVVRLPRVELAQGGGAGSALGAFAGEAWEDRAGPQLLAHLEVEVWENRTLNRPGAMEPLPSAEALALEALAALHRFRPGAGSGGCWLAARKALEPLETRKSGLAGYLVRLETQFGLPVREAAERPDAAVVGTELGPWEVTLSCATAEAQVYFTADGSFPQAENAAAVLYAGPAVLALGEGQTGLRLRAAAYMEGLRPSDVLEARLGE
jgi:hypothetical protein